MHAGRSGEARAVAVECGRFCKECEAAEGAAWRVECANAEDRELFDLGLAHELYETLIGPVEALIKDKRHLIVVPSGALTALPFHLLVTEKPAVAMPQVECAGRSRAPIAMPPGCSSAMP